jgi:hypothetical protein
MLPLALTMGFTLAAGGAATLEPRTVTKSSVYLVKAPSFLSPRASRSLLRGHQVLVEVPPKGSWFAARVGEEGAEERGFIHVTYLSDKPGAFTVKGTGLQGESLMSGNYNLAVGGFSESTERVLRVAKPDLEKGFARLEAFMPALPGEGTAALPDTEGLATFVTAGGLREPGGAP